MPVESLELKKNQLVSTCHRWLKNKTSVCASPTKTVKTQCKHIYASVMAFVKLQAIKIIKSDESVCLKINIFSM